MGEGNETSNIQEEGSELEGNQQAATELQGEGNDEPALIGRSAAENQETPEHEKHPAEKKETIQESAAHKKSKAVETLTESFSPTKTLKARLLDFYDKQYKKLLAIPIIITLIALGLIGYQYAATGEFLYKDVSLKGGVTLTLFPKQPIDLRALETALRQAFPQNDAGANTLRSGDMRSAVVIVADIDGTNKEIMDSFLSALEKFLGYPLAGEDYSVEIVGSALGTAFFRQLIVSLGIAFLLMSLVVFAYFRAFIPGITVILAAFSDIIVTLAIVNLMGMKLTTAGIAAFLMLTGYSVDTDMLLNTRVLKMKGGTIFDRTWGAVKTGMMMTLTTMTAVFVGLIFAESVAMKQIFMIIFIGMIVDSVFTWIQNVGIIRSYAEGKERKAHHYAS
ncbi:hypothetical protein HYU14_04435 [Candidatus Woesearchaeota archaeon]|nr:hypothetical protein [Candidatus Woesearchaeota archaeon]